jgi:TfoX/Sxy family transcriptional regulator of competence genes
MPSFTPSPPELVARFASVTARHPELVPRKMFGYACTFVNGLMATGLFGDTWFVRVDEAGLAELLARPGGGPFAPMGGRPTKGYALLPSDVVADDAALDAWLRRCIAFMGTLPPKT